jgi:hypothetical protein
MKIASVPSEQGSFEELFGPLLGSIASLGANPSGVPIDPRIIEMVIRDIMTRGGGQPQMGPPQQDGMSIQGPTTSQPMDVRTGTQMRIDPTVPNMPGEVYGQNTPMPPQGQQPQQQGGGGIGGFFGDIGRTALGEGKGILQQLLRPSNILSAIAYGTANNKNNAMAAMQRNRQLAETERSNRSLEANRQRMAELYGNRNVVTATGIYQRKLEADQDYEISLSKENREKLKIMIPRARATGNWGPVDRFARSVKLIGEGESLEEDTFVYEEGSRTKIRPALEGEVGALYEDLDFSDIRPESGSKSKSADIQLKDAIMEARKAGDKDGEKILMEMHEAKIRDKSSSASMSIPDDVEVPLWLTGQHPTLPKPTPEQIAAFEKYTAKRQQFFWADDRLKFGDPYSGEVKDTGVTSELKKLQVQLARIGISSKESDELLKAHSLFEKELGPDAKSMGADVYSQMFSQFLRDTKPELANLAPIFIREGWWIFGKTTLAPSGSESVPASTEKPAENPYLGMSVDELLKIDPKSLPVEKQRLWKAAVDKL